MRLGFTWALLTLGLVGLQTAQAEDFRHLFSRQQPREHMQSHVNVLVASSTGNGNGNPNNQRPAETTGFSGNIGAIVGGIAGAIALFIVIYCCCFRHTNKEQLAFSKHKNGRGEPSSSQSAHLMQDIDPDNAFDLDEEGPPTGFLPSSNKGRDSFPTHPSDALSHHRPSASVSKQQQLPSQQKYSSSFGRRAADVPLNDLGSSAFNSAYQPPVVTPQTVPRSTNNRRDGSHASSASVHSSANAFNNTASANPANQAKDRLSFTTVAMRSGPGVSNASSVGEVGTYAVHAPVQTPLPAPTSNMALSAFAAAIIANAESNSNVEATTSISTPATVDILPSPENRTGEEGMAQNSASSATATANASGINFLDASMFDSNNNSVGPTSPAIPVAVGGTAITAHRTLSSVTHSPPPSTAPVPELVTNTRTVIDEPVIIPSQLPTAQDIAVDAATLSTTPSRKAAFTIF